MSYFNYSKKENRKKIFDKFGGRCAYCGCELGTVFHVDHIKLLHRKAFHNDINIHAFENLNPSCPSCNISKNGFELEKWREQVAQKIHRINRDVSNYRLLMKFGLIKETGNDVKFYFEKYNHGKKND